MIDLKTAHINLANALTKLAEATEDYALERCTRAYLYETEAKVHRAQANLHKGIAERIGK